MTQRTDVIVFDVNGTLSDMSPLAASFEEAGVDRGLLRTWFAELLRDGFAAAATGDNIDFAVIAEDSLRRLLAGQGIASRTAADATDRIMERFTALDVHPDVTAGIPQLARVAELVTLSNGAASVAEALLRSAGLRDHVSHVLSVQDAVAWKPALGAYEYAAGQCGVEPGRMLLVAVHPWDLHGAHAAGLRTAWINRDGGEYPDYFAAPDLQAADLTDLAGRLSAEDG